jgi:hypothetical protein
MYLSTYYENVFPEEIAKNTGFKLDVTRAKQEPSPTPDELDVLRADVDPLGLILKWLREDICSPQWGTGVLRYFLGCNSRNIAGIRKAALF